MSHKTGTRTIEKALILIASILVGLTVVGVLYWAQRVLIPVALALFFAFLLNPIVMQFQRWGLRRPFAVCAVTVLSASVFAAFAWLTVSQVSNLAGELPIYTGNIKKRLEFIDELGQNSAWPQIETMIRDIGGSSSSPKMPEQPMPVVVEQSEPAWLRSLLGLFGPVSELLGQIALVAVLVIFILLSREDWRNRFIRLVGHGRLTLTTKAVDDATQRLSRFLLTQLTINASFGLCVTVGLTLIGVKFALLWGFLIAVLRYVPYIGSPAGALFPIALSIAQFDGWLEPALVVGLIFGTELVVANIVEPWLFGQSVGVSAVALLVAAAIWACLWGPVGLVLSCPLTVCLVVLGKHVPNLAFLTVLLGDEPPLEENFTYYQRLAARDDDEATEIALDFVKAHGVDDVYDTLLIPALVYANRDLLRHGLENDDVNFIHQATLEILDRLQEARIEQQCKNGTARQSESPRQADAMVTIVGIPARGAGDAIALENLKQMLEGEACQLIIAGCDMLSSELLTMIEDEAPVAVCVAAVPPGGLARARFLCKRLGARFPDLRIVVGRWGLAGAEDQQNQVLCNAGANSAHITLRATKADLLAWLPVLTDKATALQRADHWV